MSDQGRLPALYEQLERLGAEASQWAQVEASDSTALVHVGSADPDRIRERMIEVRREAREKAKALQAAAEEVKSEIRRELDRQRSEMEARMRAAMAALEPLQEQVKRMEEGIWTVNLYLGTSEEIHTLATGAPVEIETPLTLRTEVLAMDEEVAAFPVEAGETDWQGMDFRDIAMFDRWLTENPAHLAQVLPEPRGIVVFTPRRTAKVYSTDPGLQGAYINAAMNEANFESYWLIRNGENLYRLKTDFKVGRHLMPTTAEFTALFRTQQFNHQTHRHETVDITPGTREWEKAEKAQGEKQRHYMRVALIVQGLIDRTEILAPLHPAVNVMQQSTYDSGLVQVINDSERQITTSREPYFDWIRRLNAGLRPGMRIIGNFHDDGFKDHAYNRRTDREDTGTNERISPQTAEYPASNAIHYIEDRRDYRGQKGLVIRYARTKEVYDPTLWVESETRPGWGHYGGYKVPTQRASAVILPSDTFVIPFDLVTEAEMQAYLNARTERHAYASMFPLLQAAIAAKRAERAAEAPFRDLLVRVLADDNHQEPADVEPHVEALVHRFKVGNKWHRPLVSLSQDEEAKALRLIRAEYKRIVNSGATQSRDEHAVAVLRAHDPDIMFVGRLSSGSYVAFAPMPRAYPEGAVSPNLWVREHTTTKTAATIKTREWITPGTRGNKMTTLYSDDRWAGWDLISGPGDDLTDTEMSDLLEQARLMGPTDLPLLAIEHDRATRRLKTWRVDEQVRTVETRARWERTSEGIVLGAPSEDRLRREFEMSYGGNSLLDKIKPSSERSVYLPWQIGQKKTPWEEEGERIPAPTVLFEAEASILDDVRARVRAAEDAKNYEREIGCKIAVALRWVESQQERAKIEAIKAKFLTDYPDETMWEERRAELTKSVAADVKVSDDWHFRRFEDTDRPGVKSVHDRPDAHLRLDRALRTLIDAGHVEWHGLVVGDVYRLLDAPIPDIYEPLAAFSLTAPTEDATS